MSDFGDSKRDALGVSMPIGDVAREALDRSLTYDFNAIVAANIRALAGRYGYSQTDIAKALELTPGAVNQRWTGKRNWQLEDIACLASLFRVAPWELCNPRDVRGLPLSDFEDSKPDAPSFGVVIALAQVEPYLDAAWRKCRSLVQALPRDSREHAQAWDAQHYITMARQAVRAGLSEVREDE